jgi:hypothetical protein
VREVTNRREAAEIEAILASGALQDGGAVTR